jgi:predicted permease
MFESLFEDARHAVRALRRDPFLALAATVTLALAIGADTTVFSIVNSILIRPLPYPGSDRIDWISERSGPSREDVGVAPDYYRLRDRNTIFEDVAAFSTLTLNWTGVERPEQIEAAQVSVSFFNVMGSQALLGRRLTAGEEGTKAPPVAVLSYAFWRNRFGGDPHILGKTIALDRMPHTIIGVMPQGFDYPRGSQMWLPLGVDEAVARELSPSSPIRVLSIAARRKPNLTAQQVEAEMSRLTQSIRADYPAMFRTRGFRSDLVISTVPLKQHITGRVRPAVLTLSFAVGLVLLIACVNLAGLLLARAGGRRRELAVRLALGGGRGRVVRQLLTESAVLALPGGVAGLIIACVAVPLLNWAQPAILANYPPITVDLTVLAFTLVLTLATSLLFGAAPAVAAGRTPIHDALKASSLTQSLGRGAARLRKALVVAELACSLVLLLGAFLLARSFLRLVRADLGFATDHLLVFRVNPIGPMDRNYTPFYNEVLARLKQLPMARSAALLTDVPLADDAFWATARIGVMGRPVVPFVERPVVHYTTVSSEFFRTLGVPLKAGRIFDQRDAPRAGSPEPVVVNEAFVRRILPSEDPVGRLLGFGPDERNIRWNIVGVVGNVRGASLGADPPSMVYRCNCAGSTVFRASFIVRTGGDPMAAIRDVEQQVRSVDRDQPLSGVKTMDRLRDAALAPERFQLILIAAFAIIALLLAVAGVYGTMLYLVARRTREIGIRVAVGARPAHVLRIVLQETALLAVLAVAAGLAGSMALSRYARSVLFEVPAFDALTFTVAPVVLAAVVLAASVAPARRALEIDPITALRDE